VARLNRQARWLRWLAAWLILMGAIGLLLRQVVGPLLPGYFPWAGAFVLGSALTFLFVPLPTEE
jgi:hypothetical protein